MTRALLVADEDVPQPLRVEQRVIGRQDRTAGDAEDDVDRKLFERADERLRSGEFGHDEPFEVWSNCVFSKENPSSRRDRGASAQAGNSAGALHDYYDKLLHTVTVTRLMR